jgi:uncharacterized protein (UPF0548 family)
MPLRPTRPSAAEIERLLARARLGLPTYPEIGATERAALPAGYRHDRYEIPLGAGDGVFDRAVASLRAWEAQTRSAVEVLPAATPVEQDGSYLLLIRTARMWAVAPCRVVLVIDEPDRWAFAYGTVPGHPERGEASFSIDRDSSGHSVFRITSFSRSVDPFARLGAPLTRRIQQSVTRSYLEAIAAAARSAPTSS